MFNINYIDDTKDKEYYIVWQGAYSVKSKAKSNTIFLGMNNLYSMVELMRICSIYGYIYGYQQ